MPERVLVVSDLHLADGHPILDGFSSQQQAAFEDLLCATEPGEALAPSGAGVADQEQVELILNGDIFDLLAVPPYLTDGISTPTIACEKLAAIVQAHPAFFAALRRFLCTPGRRVTFLAGNHDIELVFAEAQELIRRAIIAGDRSSQIAFCQARYYYPLSGVYIEHGHQYDFWNHARDAWGADGQPLSPPPEQITLPAGTQYFQRAAHPISLRYPYFDAFDPSIDTIRQIALLCLLDPALVIETVRRVVHMLSYPRVPLAALAPREELQPALLFEKAMRDFAAFQQDMLAQDHAWPAIEATLHAQAAEQEQAADPQAEAIREFFALREALRLPPIEAVQAILAPAPYAMGESVAAGMRYVLRSDPSLRYAIAGHTHLLRRDTINTSSGTKQIYLNTASWTKREAVPTAEEITPDLLAWLRDPASRPSPLRDTTRFIFALADAIDGQPATAQLCEWVGRNEGYTRILT
jgi:UDP-2,3-diacylglucosamine pyrophosphatase LpxH